jgi:hypothetical protein
MAQLAKKDTATIARPLRVLVPLIQADFKHGKDAAEQAGLPYYRAAGEKLLEAKAQLPHGEFVPWVERHFTFSMDQANRYMQLGAASQKTLASGFSSLSDFIRQTSNPNYNRPPTTSWHEPVKDVIGRVDTETLNLKREELKRDEERDAQRRLALQLIDIGYKVLARELHPDKGGSRDAMARLNAVRARLKNCV